VGAPTEPTLRPASARRTWGFVLGGVGIAGAGVGAAFGALALSRRSTLEAESHDPSIGATRFYEDRSNANTLAAVSTAGFIVGAIGLGAGIALVATAASTSPVASLRVAPSVGSGGAGVVAGGEF